MVIPTLLDILYIPKLRVNFLLGRKIYEKGFKILFDTTKLYFKHKTSNKKKGIQVHLINRAYIITNIIFNHEDIIFLIIIIAIDFNKIVFLLLILYQELKSKEYYSDNIEDSKTNIKYNSAKNKLIIEKKRYR
jgi:hypothetical protein